MSYVLEVLAAADEENVRTIAWLREHASLNTAETYAATIARTLQEIVELPFAWPAWQRKPRDPRSPPQPDLILGNLPGSRPRREIIAFAHQSREPEYWLDRVK